MKNSANKAVEANKKVQNTANDLLKDTRTGLESQLTSMTQKVDDLDAQKNQFKAKSKKPQSMFSWLAEKFEALKQSFFNMFKSNPVASFEMPAVNPSASVKEDVQQSAMSSPSITKAAEQAISATTMVINPVKEDNKKIIL